MTEPNSAGTVLDRLRRALHLIERAADAATQGDRAIHVEGGEFDGEGWSQISVDFGQQDAAHTGPGCQLHDGETAQADARLIKASGPNHWRAVSVAIASAVEDRRLSSERAASLLPLVNQVLNDLGEYEEAAGWWVCRYPLRGGSGACNTQHREDEREAHLATHRAQADAAAAHTRLAGATGQEP